MTLTKPWVLLFLVLAPFPAGCGCNDSTPGVPDSGELQDAAVADVCQDCREAGIPDGSLADRQEWNDADLRPDAEWPPEPVEYDFCDAGFFKLPIDGQSELSYRVEMWGSGVVYDKRAAPATEYPRVMYFSLEDCKEYPITRAQDHSAGATIWNNLICFPLCRECTDEKGADLFMVDVETWDRFRLTDDAMGAMDPKLNGNHIVYLEYDPAPTQGPPPMRLLIWNTVTDEVTEIYGRTTPYFAISDGYVAWAGYFGLPGQEGKDIAYHDLQTGESTHIDSTLPWHQMGVDIWEDNIVWGTAENGVYAPFHSRLYNITTQTETEFVSGDESFCHGDIHENLIAYTTSEYRDPQLQDIWPADLMLYDIETDTHRRVTTEPCKLGNIEIFFPYLLVIDVLDVHPNMNDYYIIDMVKTGLVDAQGSLISGGPVIVPP